MRLSPPKLLAPPTAGTQAAGYNHAERGLASSIQRLAALPRGLLPGCNCAGKENYLGLLPERECARRHGLQRFFTSYQHSNQSRLIRHSRLDRESHSIQRWPIRSARTRQGREKEMADPVGHDEARAAMTRQGRPGRSAPHEGDYSELRNCWRTRRGSAAWRSLFRRRGG